MTQEFVTYEQALALKELGFDEPCLSYYNIDPFLKSPTFNLTRPFEHEWCLPAPLYQQAFRWFREKYGLYNYIRQYYGEKFYFHIEDMVFPRRYEEYPIEKIRNFGEQYSQEEAELECLKKLIEIVKQK